MQHAITFKHSKACSFHALPLLMFSNFIPIKNTVFLIFRKTIDYIKNTLTFRYSSHNYPYFYFDITDGSAATITTEL